MIEPDKNGHRSGSVARGVARQVASGKTGVRLTWILTPISGVPYPISGVRRARRRRVRDPSSSTGNAVAGNHRKRSGEPVQTALAKCERRRDGGQRCRAVHVPPKPERRLSLPAPLSMDTGTGSAVGWINLTTCVSSGKSPRSIVLPFRLR